MSRIIDFHSHILPGIDDGSSSVEESIAMLQKEAKQGICHVVATPHFYPQQDKPERFLERRAKAEFILRQEMERYDGLPELSVGAEIYYFSGISRSDVLKELAIDHGRCVLIEMPQPPWTEKMYQELVDIYERQGLTPILAHIDRYIRPFHTYKIPERLEQMPVLVQANASFFLNASTQRMALRMLRKDQIQLLGSDCHNLSSRAPNLGPAVRVIRDRLDQGAIAEIYKCQRIALGK